MQRVESPTEPESGVLAVSVGSSFACRIVTNGEVECWGDGGNGTLGHGHTMSSQVPVRVEGLATPIVQLASGTSHTCALTMSGTLQCWGTNFFGELGDGAQAPASVAVDVDGLSGVTSVAAGGSLTCALLGDGSVWCWGLSGEGWDGSGPGEGVLPAESILKSLVPVQVAGVEGATEIAVGIGHGCAVVDAGRVRCWGANMFGQLGDGTMERSAGGVLVMGDLEAAHIAASQAATCAVTTSGAVVCWGSGYMGQLGYMDDFENDRSAIPLAVEGVEGVVALDGGADFFCAALDDGSVRCWGSNRSEMLGEPDVELSATPLPVRGVAGAVEVDSGDFMSCAILEGDRMQCWGYVGPWR